MYLDQKGKEKLFKKHGKNAKDTGSAEGQIALFTQSVDTRANSYLLNEKQSRVSFGSHWQTGTITDIFKDNITRFRSFLTTDFTRDSVKMIENNETPRLRALQLHNGTVYPWNRVCYGVLNDKATLRIENRYIPSGPTTDDEIANMMFWVGVMLGKPKTYNNIHKQWDFKDVKTNFFNAARYGMATQFYWNGQYISSYNLILNELLPMAYKGLYSAGVSPKDAEFYLKVIKNRVQAYNGSEWLIRNYRNLLKTHKRYEAMQILTAKVYEKQGKYEKAYQALDVFSDLTDSLYDKESIQKIDFLNIGLSKRDKITNSTSGLSRLFDSKPFTSISLDLSSVG